MVGRRPTMPYPGYATTFGVDAADHDELIKQFVHKMEQFQLLNLNPKHYYVLILKIKIKHYVKNYNLINMFTKQKFIK
jgi:hypothetical protein